MASSADKLILEFGAEAVVAALAPILTDERRERIEQVLDARLISVAILLENLYDPHNGAATIRSAEAFGVTDIHAIEVANRFDISSAITIGADRWLDVHRHRSVADAMSALRDAGFAICATVPEAALRLGELDAGRPWAIAFGNEHEGLSPELVAACDAAVSIPMFGFTQSFNLSVSVALALADLTARRRRELGRSGDLPEDRRAHLRARWYAQTVRGARAIVARTVSE